MYKRQGEALDGETVGIVVRTGRVQKAARGHEAALGDVALPDDLPVSYTHLDVYKRQI